MIDIIENVRSILELIENELEILGKLNIKGKEQEIAKLEKELEELEQELECMDDSNSLDEVNIHGIAYRAENVVEKIEVMVNEKLTQDFHLEKTGYPLINP